MSIAWNEKHLVKMVTAGDRLKERIERREREHKSTAELRARLVRIRAEEIRTMVRLEKRKAVA